MTDKNNLILNFRNIENDNFKGTEIRAINKLTKKVVTLCIADRCYVQGIEDIGITGLDFHTINMADLEAALSQVNIMIGQS